FDRHHADSQSASFPFSTAWPAHSFGSRTRRPVSVLISVQRVPVPEFSIPRNLPACRRRRCRIEQAPHKANRGARFHHPVEIRFCFPTFPQRLKAESKRIRSDRLPCSPPNPG